MRIISSLFDGAVPCGPAVDLGDTHFFLVTAQVGVSCAQTPQ